MKLLREKGEAEILRKKKNSKYCMSDMDNCNILGVGGREGKEWGVGRGGGGRFSMWNPPPPRLLLGCSNFRFIFLLFFW
jgi:hypothetical protein